MKTILIIEDNLDIRENIAELLQLSGYKTIQAENGQDGVKKAQMQLPDLIICDIMIPQMDGYQVLQKLSENPQTHSIPFVFLTAKADMADFKKGLSVGADDYITKPFTEEDILNSIALRLQKVDNIKFTLKSQNGITDISPHAHYFDLSKFISIHDYHSKIYYKKDFIFLEGNRAHFLYYVKSGFVKVYRLHERGKEFILDIHGAGSFFGHYALIEECPYQNHAQALENSEIIQIPKIEFMKTIYSNAEAQKTFIQYLSNTVIRKEEELIYVAYNTLKQRTVRALIELYYEYEDDSKMKARIPLTREEVSKYIGTARESFIRIMTKLKDENLLQIEQGDIVIHDIQLLKSYL